MSDVFCCVFVDICYMLLVLYVVVVTHVICPINIPNIPPDKYPFYLQKAILELGPVNVKRYLYFGSQHHPWYCEKDWTHELKRSHEDAFLKLMFHYCALKKGDVRLDSLF